MGADILIKKLDEFIKKYYKNLLLRGAIYTASIFVIFFLLFSILEYFGNFNITIRTIMFYSFLGLNLLIFSRYIFLPIFKLFKIGKTITYTEASQIIGNHFTDVNDKLINTLQLSKISDYKENSLLIASIEQKTNELKPVPFTAAIDLSENRKYLKYLFIPFLILLGILLFNPALITEGTKRIVSHGTYFEPVAPFNFHVLNKSLNTFQGEDFVFRLQLKGDQIPDKAYINIAGIENKMNKESSIDFSYTFVSPDKSTEFYVVAGGYKSPRFVLNVLPKPMILSMKLSMDYPDYLKMKDEELNNQGDITVPEGTKISWFMKTNNTDKITVLFNDTNYVKQIAGDQLIFSRVISDDQQYGLVPANNYVKGNDTLSYFIKVIPDLYPVIDVTEEKDTLTLTRLYFSGSIKDDYGLRSLYFHYKIEGKENINEWKKFQIPISQQQIEQSFAHYFDTDLLKMKLGEKLTYYFEVWDNDGVNGSKNTRTIQRVFVLPTKEDLQKNIDQTNKEIKSSLSDNKEALNDIQKEINDLSKSLLQKKEVNWDDKNKLEKLLEKQKEIQQNINKTKEQNDLNNDQKNKLSEDEQRILDKQQEINKRFDELNNDELNKMLEELEKMMDKMDKNKLQDMLKDLKMTNEDIEKELDRTLELFKQMELEQKLDETIQKLDELKKEQEKLSNETKENSKDSKDLEKKQNELNDKFNEIKDDIKKLNELNNELENKNDIPDFNEQIESIDNDMKDAGEQLQKNQNSKSSQKQKSASNKMDQLQQQLQQTQQQMQSNQSQENLEDLRQILDNLLKLSFDQEEVIDKLKNINKNNPVYKDLMKSQRKLIDDSKIIEDSLHALSKRMVELESFVNKEISTIKKNMGSSLEFLESRNTAMANQKQQYALTSINNLALMLSESIEQMQQQMMQQMQQQMNGNNSCTKPGSSKPGMTGLLQKQKALQEKMGELQQKMKGEGKKDGNGNSGNGEGEIHKDLVKLASEQEMIRNELQNMLNGMNQDQRKIAQEIIKKMEENETDLLNKRITGETLKRQNEITIKMMESEKALREQEQDEKRKSKEGEDLLDSNNPKLEDYFKKKKKEIELLRTIPPNFTPYYKTKVSTYFYRF